MVTITIRAVAEYRERMPSRAAATTGSQSSIADVAALAGVSGQTVSRVANGSSRVAPETRRKVLEAMAKLDYSPNVAARALRRGDYGTIGVLAHRLGHTGEASTVEAIAAAARKHGQTIALVDVEDADSSAFEDAAARLSLLSIDALIIVRANIDDPSRLVLPRRLRVFASDRRFDDRYPTIGTDEAGGIAAVMDHLLSLGHRRIAHIAGPDSSWAAQARESAWRTALEAAGLPATEPIVGDWSAASGRAAMTALLERSGDLAPTAVVCANDEMAFGAVSSAVEAGLSVPADLSVTGFDDIPLAGFSTPPLTSVTQDFARIGRELVEAALGESHSAVVPATLVIRESTAPPRSA